jgi:hypothetical protein
MIAAALVLLICVLLAFPLSALRVAADAAANRQVAADVTAKDDTWWWRPALHWTPAENWINDPNVRQRQHSLALQQQCAAH